VNPSPDATTWSRSNVKTVFKHAETISRMPARNVNSGEVCRAVITYKQGR
jgi:hypothetical protein